MITRSLSIYFGEGKKDQQVCRSYARAALIYWMWDLDLETWVLDGPDHSR